MQQTTDQSLKVTPAALAHIKKMLAKQVGGIGMRLAIKETGCSGKTYQVSLIDKTEPNDHVFMQEDDLIICIDPKSFVFVCGTTIDYARQGLGGSFVFLNPNEKGSCGCGESFNV